jgi:hypothetical protein
MLFINLISERQAGEPSYKIVVRSSTSDGSPVASFRRGDAAVLETLIDDYQISPDTASELIRDAKVTGSAEITIG